MENEEMLSTVKHRFQTNLLTVMDRIYINGDFIQSALQLMSHIHTQIGTSHG